MMDIKYFLYKITSRLLLKLHLISEGNYFNANIIVTAHRKGLRIKTI